MRFGIHRHLGARACYTLMLEAMAAEGGVVDQLVRDGLMAIFRAPLPLADHSAAAARAALAGARARSRWQHLKHAPARW